MYDVPAAWLTYDRGNLRSEVVVPIARPGRDAKNAHTVETLRARTLTSAIGRQYGDVKSIERRQAASYLVDVRLDATEIGKVTRADHQDAQPANASQILVPSDVPT
jgi:hypothetical protein